jgi:hypothetical protein
MLLEWLRSLKSRAKTQNSFLFKDLLTTLGFVLSGYMISGFPKEFLDLFQSPVGQFIVFFIINYGLYAEDGNKRPMREIVMESFLDMFVLQLMFGLVKWSF